MEINEYPFLILLDVMDRGDGCPMELEAWPDEQFDRLRELVIREYEKRLFASQPTTSADRDKKMSELEELQDKLHQIKTWINAYPLEIFPEPDFKKAAKVLKQNDMTLDAISTSNMRHVLNGIKDIIEREPVSPADRNPQCPACYTDMQVIWECKKCGHTIR